MYPDEIGHLEDAFTLLSQSTAGKTPTVKLTSAHVETVIQMLNRWPASQRFPGAYLVAKSPEPFALTCVLLNPVIDLARLLSGFCADLIDNGTFFDALFRAAELSIDNAPSSSKAKETNVLLVLRTVANAFQENTKTSDDAWIVKVRSHLVRVALGCSHKSRLISRSLEFSTEFHMRNSRGDNASPYQQYSLSKAPLFYTSPDYRRFLSGFYVPLV